MELIDFFKPEEQTILKEVNKSAWEYFGGEIKMTSQQKEEVSKYIALKLLLEWE